MPFPLLLLVTGAITCVIGVLVGLPALRLSGLYLALITLMFAGATTIFLSVTDFPNGGGGFTGRLGDGCADDVDAARPPARRGQSADVAFYRYTAIVAADPVPARARARRDEARPRMGVDP